MWNYVRMSVIVLAAMLAVAAPVWAQSYDKISIKQMLEAQNDPAFQQIFPGVKIVHDPSDWSLGGYNTIHYLSVLFEPTSASGITIEDSSSSFWGAGLLGVWGDNPRGNDFALRNLSVGSGGITITGSGMLMVGDQGLKIEYDADGDAILGNDYVKFGAWVDSAGAIVQSGNNSTVIISGALTTGTPDVLGAHYSNRTGEYRLNGGSLVLWDTGKLITGKLTTSSASSMQLGVKSWLQASERLSARGGMVFAPSHEIMRSVKLANQPFVNAPKIISSAPVELAYSAEFLLWSNPDAWNPISAGAFSKIPQLVPIYESAAVQDESDGSITATQVRAGSLQVTGDLFMTGGVRGTASIGGFVAETTALNAGVVMVVGNDPSIIFSGDGPSGFGENYRPNIAQTGSLVFSNNSRVTVDAGDLTFLTYTTGNMGDERWEYADTESSRRTFTPSINAADDAEALFEMRKNGRLLLGYCADADTWNASKSDAFITHNGTLSINAKTVIELDYNRAAGYGDCVKAPQIIIAKGGEIKGSKSLTLGINARTAPASLKVGEKVEHAVLIGSAWRYDDTVGSETRIENAYRDLNDISFKNGHRYGLFDVSSIQIETLVLDNDVSYEGHTVAAGQADSYITGTITKVSAGSVIDPGDDGDGDGSGGISPEQDLLAILDDYQPGNNLFMDSVFENLGINPTRAYADFASAVNFDAVIGGSATAYQAADGAWANVAGRMKPDGSSSLLTAAAFASNAAALASPGSPDLNRNRWQGGWSMWTTPIYSHNKGRKLSLAGVGAGYSSNLGGVTVGVDTTTCDGRFRFGVAGHIGGGKTNSGGAAVQAKNNFTFGGVDLYAGANVGGFVVAAGAGWFRNRNDVDFTGLDPVKYNTDVWSAHLSVERDFDVGVFTVTPRVGVEYSHLKQDGYTLRSGNRDSFRTGKSSADMVALPVEVTMRRDIRVGCGVVTPEVTVGWIPSVGDRDVKYATTVFGAPGAAQGISALVDRHTGKAGAGLRYENEKIAAGVEYEYRFSKHYRSHNVGATFALKF